MALTITIQLDDAQEAAVVRAVSQRTMMLPPGATVEIDARAYMQAQVDQLVTVGVSLLASEEDARILQDWKKAVADPETKAALDILVKAKT